MRSLNKYVLLGAAAVLGFSGCESFHGRSSDERSQGRMVDDRQITADVRSELKREPVYKFTDVDVKTFGGIVQLSGFVNTDGQKRRAGEIAQNVQGVTQVQNAISLKPETANPTPSPTGRTTTSYGTNNPPAQ